MTIGRGIAIKQNLKIKTFVGTSPNAIMIQIWTAVIYNIRNDRGK